jgi:predicted deacylase
MSSCSDISAFSRISTDSEGVVDCCRFAGVVEGSSNIKPEFAGLDGLELEGIVLTGVALEGVVTVGPSLAVLLPIPLARVSGSIGAMTDGISTGTPSGPRLIAMVHLYLFS